MMLRIRENERPGASLAPNRGLVNKLGQAYVKKCRSGESDEGHFTHSKTVRAFFRTKGLLRTLDGFFLKSKGCLKEYEIFGSEIPLGGNRDKLVRWRHKNEIIFVHEDI